MKPNNEKHLLAQKIAGFILLALIFTSIVGEQRSSIAATLAQGQRIPLVLFGVDAADASQHTDTLMIAVFDPLRRSLSVLSVPRDTKVDLPGYRFHRINEIYGFHVRRTQDPIYSSLEVLKGIEEVLSTEETRVSFPYFIQVDYSGFAKIVDLLGGVWVHIRQPMHYDDNAGNYHFHKEPGRYFMKGKEALAYVRFRNQSGDRGRILRQHEFLRTMLLGSANPLMLVRLPQLASTLVSMVKTNLSFWDWISLLSSIRRVRPDDVGFYILPGAPSGAYWSLKKEAAAPLISRIVLGQPVTETPETMSTSPLDRTSVKVWNASGKKGIAYRVTKYLRKGGFDVLDWGNFETVQSQTRIIDRSADIEKAQAIANYLGVESYHSEPNPNALVDVEVVLGSNYVGPAAMEW